MDTIKVWFTLLCVCAFWIFGSAINCDWKTQYEYNGRCCKACPVGMYPKEHCSENSDVVCDKCPTDPHLVKKPCFCENQLCLNNDCSQCESRKRCKRGEELMRVGAFDYTYNCKPCPNNTYNNEEDSMCKPIEKCNGLQMIFPGNRTHNSRCGLYDYSTDRVSSILQTHTTMMVCLILAVLICLALVMYASFQSFKYKRLRKLNQPFTRKMALPSDACNCKLSKEEKGDECDSKATSEFSFTCEVQSIP